QSALLCSIENGAGFLSLNIRLLKEAKLELETQHAPHRLINGFHRHTASLNLIFERGEAIERGKFHIHSGQQRQSSRLARISRHKMMGLQQRDREIIGHYSTIEA